MNDLIQQTVEQSQHHDDEVVCRRLDEHLAVMSDEVEARLNEPVEQVAQHVSMFLSHCTRQLQSIAIVRILAYTHGIAVEILSVRLSVCQARVL